MPADGTAAPTTIRAYRCDRGAVVGEYEVTHEGYVRTLGRIAKPGIMVYRDASGKVTRELVPQSTLEDPEFLASLENKPLTVEHPPVMLTPENIGEYRKGMVLAPVRFEGGYVVAPIQVDDAAAIAAMKAGKVELSPGYEVDLDPTPGVDPVYGPFDATQAKRYGGNHTALCDKARGGADIRLLRTDSAVEVDAESVSETVTPTPTEPPVYKMSDTLGAAMKAHGMSDADIAACKSDEDAHSMLMGAAKKDEPKADEVAPELAAKQAEIVKLSADLAKAQGDLAVMVEQHELVSGDMAAKVDDLMEDPDMEAGMDAAMKMDSARKDAVKSARRRNFDAIRALAITRTDLEAFAETVGIVRTDSAKLGNAALTKRVALKVSPKLAGDKTAAYYSAALDMARSTRLDSADPASFWKRKGEENSKLDSETSYVRTI
jgi:hypothetical protein